MKHKSKRVNIGDVVEVSTSAGLGYVQYTYSSDSFGELVRVLHGLYKNRPTNFVELVESKELYFAFYLLKQAVSSGNATVVANLPIPDEWRNTQPAMRHSAFSDAEGRTTKWRIISASSALNVRELQRTPTISQLTSEQQRLSLFEVWPHAAMVRNLALGWTPERAEDIRTKDLAEASRSCSTQEDHSSNEMRHYLYFPNKSDSSLAGEALRSRGFLVQEDTVTNQKQWLVLASGATPVTSEHIDEQRQELEQIAARFGGDYDGWEAPFLTNI